jgi:hypothetical protein
MRRRDREAVYLMCCVKILADTLDITPDQALDLINSQIDELMTDG